MMESQLCLLTVLLHSLPAVHSHIWAWMYSLPHPNDNEVASPKYPGQPASLELTPYSIYGSLGDLAYIFDRKQTVCNPETSCPEGLFCDHHFGLCLTLWQEGEFCRQDAHCAEGLSCMFGKCHPTVPGGQEGARCHQDKDCSPDACCARLHGEMVCKKRLLLDEGCYIPQGGIGFSVNQVCPCLEGLVCKRMLPDREVPFEYGTDKSDWRCKKN